MLEVRAPWWARIPMIGNLGAPIILKEVFSLVRRNRWFWAQFIYLLVLAAGMAVIYASNSSMGLPPEDLGGRLVNAFFTLQAALVCLIFPGLAATSISAERSEKSFDLLIVSDLSPAELVWGKLIGILGSAFYFLVSTLPILGVCIFLGGLSPIAIIADYAFLFLLALIVSAWGIFISAMSKNNLLAIVGTYALALALGVFTSVFVSAMLIEEGARGILEVIGLVPPGFQLAVLATIATTILSFLAICLFGATFFLSSPESLRGTPVRVFVIFWVGATTLLLKMWWEKAPGFGSFSERVLAGMGQSLLIVYACFLMLVVIAVAGGRTETPLRAVYLAQRNRTKWTFLWPLVSGGIRGPLVAALLLFASLWALEGTLVGLIDDVQRSEAQIASGVQPSHNGALLALIFPWLAAHLGAWVFAYIGFAFLLSTLGLRGGINWFLTAGVAVLLALLSIGRVAASSHTINPDMTLFSPLVTILTRFSDGRFDGTVPYDASYYGHWIAGALFIIIGMGILRSQRLPVFGLRRPAYDFLFSPRGEFAATPELAEGEAGTAAGEALADDTAAGSTAPSEARPPGE